MREINSLERLVCSIELARDLMRRELFVPSCLVWYQLKLGRTVVRPAEDPIPEYIVIKYAFNAYTSAELSELLLPYRILLSVDLKSNCGAWWLYDEKTEPTIGLGDYSLIREVDAGATALIGCIQRGLLSVENLNKKYAKGILKPRG